MVHYATVKIPVFRTAGTSLRSLLANPTFVLKLFVPLVLTIILLQLAFGALATALGKPLIVFLWLAPYGLVAIPFYIAWMRFVVTGSEAEARWRIGHREREFLTVGLKMFCLMLPVTAICSFAAIATYRLWLSNSDWFLYLVAIDVFLLALLIWAGTRWILIFPAIAMDSFQGIFRNIQLSWSQTRGCFWRIQGILFVSALPVTFAQSIIHRLMISGQPLAWSIAVIVDVTFMVLLAAAQIGAIASIYKQRAAAL